MSRDWTAMTQEFTGPGNRILEVDLSTGKVSIYQVKDKERRLYLGAKGLGLKLLFDRLKPGRAPLGPDNILAIMPGVLLGMGGPCTGRFHALAKSPLTGIISTSSCGGPFGLALRTAGWGGILVSGSSEKPVYILIDEHGASIHAADHLWGKSTVETQDVLDDEKQSSLLIGPAGENLVRYANVRSGKRFLGRGGLGAVMGAKKLKALVACGGAYRIAPVSKKEYKRAAKRGSSYIARNEMSAVRLRNYGTNSNVNPNNRAGILPVKNFSDGRDDRAYQISGEMVKDVHTTRFETCKPCKILCGHKGNYGGKTLAVPEYETTAMLGSNLDIFDRQAIAEFNELCGELGLDTISTGGTLGWAMEAAEKGLIDMDLRFGEQEKVAEVIADIAYGRGFGKELGLGCRALSEKYGGQDFAMQVKGLEMAAYDPRGSFGQGLAYAVANRGPCHLSAYLVALENYFGLLKPDTIRAKPEFVIFFERLTCCINALQTCQFTMYSYTLEPLLSKYTPDLILGLLMQNIPKLAIALIDFSTYTQLWNGATGIRMSNREFLQAGDRIHVLERYMNIREGGTGSEDILPLRLTKEPLPCDAEKKTVPIDDLVPRYYSLRGYDQNGAPGKNILKKLKINEV